MRTTKQKALAALLALALFGAGAFLGYRLAWERPLPPVPPFGAFGPGHPGHGGPRPGPAFHPTPQQAAAIAKDLEALQPQLEAFQQGFAALDADFHAKFSALLTPEQREKLPPYHGEEADWVGEFNQAVSERALGEPPPPPSRARDPRHLLGQVLRILMPEPSLRILTERFGLSAAQQGELAKLLEARRQAFLNLAAEHPLPYDQLYLTVRKLGMVPEGK